MTIYHRLGTFPLISNDKHPGILCFGIWRGGNTVTFALSTPGPVDLMQHFDMPQQAIKAFEAAVTAADKAAADASRCVFCGKVMTTPCLVQPLNTCWAALPDKP